MRAEYRLAIWRVLLLSMLGGLVAYLVATDHSAPAWGESQLPGIALWIALLLAATLTVVGVIRAIKRRA